MVKDAVAVCWCRSGANGCHSTWRFVRPAAAVDALCPRFPALQVLVLRCGASAEFMVSGGSLNEPRRVGPFCSVCRPWKGPRPGSATPVLTMQHAYWRAAQIPSCLHRLRATAHRPSVRLPYSVAAEASLCGLISCAAGRRTPRRCSWWARGRVPGLSVLTWKPISSETSSVPGGGPDDAEAGRRLGKPNVFIHLEPVALFVGLC